MFGKRKEVSCSKVRRLLSPYIDERVSARERERVEEHVRTCLECRRELDSLQMTVRLLHRVPTAPPPRSFALGAEFAKRPTGQPRLLWPHPATALVMALRQPGLLWLRPATALAVAVLLFLFAGDMLQVFEPTALPQPTPTPAPLVPEEPKFLAPGARDVTEEPAPPALPEATPSYPVTPPQEAGRPWAGFWLHQIEIGFAALVLVLGSIWLFTIRQRKRRSGVTRKAG